MPESFMVSGSVSRSVSGQQQLGGDLRADVIAALFGASEEGALYDPSDLTTLFQDSAGTTPVTADGDPVGRMEDLSGNGNHATQATAAARPLYKTDGTLHWLLFDGTDDFLSTAAIDMSALDTALIAVGCTKPSISGRIVAELSANMNFNVGSFYLLSGNATVNGFESIARGDAVASANQTATKAVAAGTYSVIATHDISGDLSQITVDGVAGTDGTGDKGAGNFGNYPLYIGMRGGVSLPYNGKIYGLAMSQQIANTTKPDEWLTEKAGL